MEFQQITPRHHARLILIFAGWAMDWRPFEGLERRGYDIAVVWDYRDMNFDPKWVEGYSEIYVLAWSMGVVVASKVTAGWRHVMKRVAVGGTLTPVDDRCGIPVEIFKATRQALSLNSMQKFYMRVVGGSAAYDNFREPERDVKQLGAELDAIAALQAEPCRWDVAIITQRDRIFPPDNQRNAWAGKADVVKEIDSPHYPDFARLLRMFLIDKSLVVRRFSERKQSYDSSAKVQRRIIDLLKPIIKKYTSEAREVLEIGCGTGILTRIVSSMTPDAHLTMWDIVDNAPEDVPGLFVCCDAELQIQKTASDSHDLIVSASTMQWFNSPGRFLEECVRVLHKGGVAVITTFRNGNLAEIGSTLPLPTTEEIERMLPKGLRASEVKPETFKLEFNTPLDALRHVHQTGVNAVDDSIEATTSARRFMRNNDGPATLTYTPVIILMRKD